MIKNLAAKAKRSEKEVQYLWHKAKAIVKAEYNVDEHDGAFWGLTTGITKKMLGMKESLSFKQFLLEAADGDKPSYSSMDVETAINFLNAKCRDSL